MWTVRKPFPQRSQYAEHFRRASEMHYSLEREISAI